MFSFLFLYFLEHFIVFSFLSLSFLQLDSFTECFLFLEDIDILEDFTYLGNVVQNSGGSGHEVFRRIGLAHAVMNSLDTSIWRCHYLCRRTKIRIFRSLVFPVLLYSCKTWKLTGDLERRIEAIGNKCLRRIMGCRWFDRVTNRRLLRETGSRPIVCTIQQRQLRL